MDAAESGLSCANPAWLQAIIAAQDAELAPVEAAVEAGWAGLEALQVMTAVQNGSAPLAVRVKAVLPPADEAAVVAEAAEAVAPRGQAVAAEMPGTAGEMAPVVAGGVAGPVPVGGEAVAPVVAVVAAGRERERAAAGSAPLRGLAPDGEAVDRGREGFVPDRVPQAVRVEAEVGEVRSVAPVFAGSEERAEPVGFSGEEDGAAAAMPMVAGGEEGAAAGVRSVAPVVPLRRPSRADVGGALRRRVGGQVGAGAPGDGGLMAVARSPVEGARGQAGPRPFGPGPGGDAPWVGMGEAPAASQGQGGAAGGREAGGTVNLDGRLVGRWMVERMARDAARPGAGMTGFDARQAPAWTPSGAL